MVIVCISLISGNIVLHNVHMQKGKIAFPRGRCCDHSYLSFGSGMAVELQLTYHCLNKQVIHSIKDGGAKPCELGS